MPISIKSLADVRALFLVLFFIYCRSGYGGLVVNTSDSRSRGLGFEPHSGRLVMSLSKTYLPPNSTGNTQEAVAPSQHH